MSLWLPNGAGESTGDTLVTGKNYVHLASGLVFYVGATNASDTSNTGLEALRPLATIGQAHTTASNYDTIILQDAFTQTLTALQTISKNVVIAAGGANSGNPTASLIMNAAAATMLSVTGAAVEFRNIKFPVQAQVNTSPRILLSGTVTKFIGCRFEANGNDGGAVIRIDNGANNVHFENCTFVNTATASAARPCSFILLSSTTANCAIYMKGCALDAGTVGMDNTNTGAGSAKKGYAVDLTEAVLTLLRAESMTFLRGADVGLDSTAATPGFVQAPTVTGGAFVRYV